MEMAGKNAFCLSFFLFFFFEEQQNVIYFILENEGDYEGYFL